MPLANSLTHDRVGNADRLEIQPTERGPLGTRLNESMPIACGICLERRLRNLYAELGFDSRKFI